MTSILAQPKLNDRWFDRLYRAHVQDVYRYSLMLLRNRADAEDVAQTTFMKAYRAIQRGERPQHPRQWLITIAHNTVRTRVRDDTRRPQEVAFDEELTQASAPSAGDVDVDVRELVKALGALSFNQRSALVMRELEGRTYTEIAEVLEISGSAVETLLFRARRALREQLEGSLTCGETERALSLQLDGRLDLQQRRRLRAHLRECGECASLARRQRARRAALRSLGPLPLPASLASWGGTAAAPGVAVKVAAILAAGVAAAGTTQDDVHAVTDPAPRVERALVASVAPGVSHKVVQAAPVARRDAPAVVVFRPALRSRTTLVHEPGDAQSPPTHTPTAPPPGPVSTPTPAAESSPVPTVSSRLQAPQPAATVPSPAVPPVTVDTAPPVSVTAPPVAALPPVTVVVRVPTPPLEVPTLP